MRDFIYKISPLSLLYFSALLAEASKQKQADFRTYRAEKNYAVSSGKWYFEFEILTAGPMRVGKTYLIVFYIVSLINHN